MLYYLFLVSKFAAFYLQQSCQVYGSISLCVIVVIVVSAFTFVPSFLEEYHILWIFGHHRYPL